MRKFGKKLIVMLMICALLIPQISFAALYDSGSGYTWNGKYYAAYKQSEKDISIAYTANTQGNYSGQKEGGLARAVTALADIRKEYPDSYFLDAGNFMGGEDPFSNDKKDPYALNIMSGATYDAVALGNAELGNENLKTIIDDAKEKNKDGNKLPKLITSNTKLSDSLTNKIDNNGSTSYKVIKKYNSKIALFAINDNSDSKDLEKNDVKVNDPKESAKKVVEKAKNEKVDLVVCLYSGKKSEDEDPAEKLAKEVDGIDLIISGTSKSESNQVGNTAICGVSDSCQGIGHIVLSKDNNNKFKLNTCKERKLGDNVEEDQSILDIVAEHQEDYFKKFGYKANGKLATNDINFTAISEFGKEQGDDSLGNIISDSYLYTAGKETNKDIKGVCSVVANGAVHNSIKTGKVTASQVFSMFDQKAGSDKLAGADMIKVYVTGAELRLLAEVDASLSTGDNGLRLYTSGLGYEYNPNRFYLNKISDYWYKDKEKIEDKELYALITDTETLKIIKEGNSSPLGILDVIFKDVHGNVVEDLDKMIIKNGDKNLKAWESLAQYMYDKDIDSSYAKPANHKVLIDDSSLVGMFKNPGKSFILIACGMIIGLAVLILLIIFIIYIIKKILKVPPKSKYRSLYGKNENQAPIFKHRRNRYADKTRRKFK